MVFLLINEKIWKFTRFFKNTPLSFSFYSIFHKTNTNCYHALLGVLLLLYNLFCRANSISWSKILMLGVSPKFTVLSCPFRLADCFRESNFGPINNTDFLTPQNPKFDQNYLKWENQTALVENFCSNWRKISTVLSWPFFFPILWEKTAKRAEYINQKVKNKNWPMPY